MIHIHAYEDEGCRWYKLYKRNAREIYYSWLVIPYILICDGKECDENKKKILALLKKTLDINELTEEWNEQFLESESGPVDPDYEKLTRAERQDNIILIL